MVLHANRHEGSDANLRGIVFAILAFSQGLTFEQLRDVVRSRGLGVSIHHN